ncbi:MAG: transglycosylase domain-containing protein, partial [Acidobacteria bacterium]|nr:transglycosylase domain-containing protein [Acidobacteriota bacterium]
MRVRLGRGFLTSRWGLALLCSLVLVLLVCASVFAYFYIQFSQMIDARLSGQIDQSTSRVYTAPQRIFDGEKLTAAELCAQLREAGYAETELEGSPGQFHVKGSTVEIRPSANSYFGGERPIQVEFAGREIRKIRSLKDMSALANAEIEPELLTNLFDTNREKRRPVRFEDLPKHVVEAVLAAEDKRFFEHPGLDPVRVVGALWADLRPGSKRLEGASTLTMQVARSFFFSLRREWGRKLSETLVALQLEQRFSKQQIFEMYANEIYLGNRGSFAIHGFGEAAQAYFGKDVRQLTLGEAAFLAAIIRAPNRYTNTERSPEHAAEARDRVLKQMVENGQLRQEEADAARKARLQFVGGGIDTSAAPYFVDLVKDHLLEKITEADLVSQSYRIYTTLDPRLQRAAGEAVESGMKDVDALLAKKYGRWQERAKKTGEDVPRAQVALIALDPKTGEIKAL